MAEAIKIAYNEDTRTKLMNAHHALWDLNLRHHRGDEAFRGTIHRLRQETADLIDALDASYPESSST